MTNSAIVKDKIKNSDIIKSIEILRLRPTFLYNELREHYVKYAERFHPEAIEGDIEIYKQIIFAYELLFFFQKKIKTNNVKAVIDEINHSQLSIINQKVLEYSEMSLEDFLKKTYKSSLALRIFEFFIYSIIIIVSFVMVLSFLSTVFSENSNIKESIYFGTVVLSIVPSVVILFMGKISYKKYVLRKKLERQKQKK